MASFIPNLWAWVVMSEPVSEDWLDVLFHLVPYLSVRLTLTQILCFLLDLLHLSLDVVLFPVVANNAFEGLCVLYPLN